MSLINQTMVKGDLSNYGEVVTVKRYDGSYRTLHTWTTLHIHLAREDFTVEALVVRDVELLFILSRPDMKKLRMNISSKMK